MAGSSKVLTARAQRVAQAARNAARTRSTIANWPEFLGYIALGRAGMSGKQLTVRTRSGVRMRTLNHDLSWTPVYEVFVEDSYHLGDVPEMAVSSPKVLDLGGHIGSFSVALASRYPTAHVWCYEPSPASFQFLQGNVRANGLAGQVDAFNVAVGPEDGTAVLYSDGDISAQSSLSSSAVRATYETEVPVRSFVGAIEAAGGLVDLVKMDIEGGEYPLFDECGPEVWQAIRALLIEYHSVGGRGFADVEGVLGPLGFTTVWRADTPRAGCGTAYLRNAAPQPMARTEPAS